MNSHQDYDPIRAEEIQKGDTIEFPCNHPDVQWLVEEGVEARCNEPGVLWYVEELAGSVLGLGPAGDLYLFTVREVGVGAEVDVKISGHGPVQRIR